MAGKKPTSSIDRLTNTVERGFAALTEDIDDIKQTMATKEQIVALATHVASIEQELKTIRRDLNDLIEKVENISGYRKEIDHALDRIAAIEKHLGITKKLAA